jgi:tRNA nucleotidyltransferase (CCA-adding enzyme)
MNNISILDNEIKKIFGATPIYYVGGVCRSLLLGYKPNDIDMATPISPDEIEKAIRKAGRKPYLVGKRFGTIGFKVETETGYKYVEVTTFRNEQYKEGSRKPEVSFVKDITADLSRRDFTINALALRDGKLIDPFNGQEDLKNGIIKAVGQPSHRFKEDPLRMLRACRFASQLGFNIEEKTFESMKQLNYKILEVSRERWMIELDKLLMTDKPVIGLNYLMESRLLNFMIPELALQYKYEQNNPHHEYDLWTHTLNVVENTSKDINLRWGSLLHDCAKPYVRTDREDRSNYIKHDLLGKEIVIRLARYLKWSNERTEIISDLVLNHVKDESPLKEADTQGKKNAE